MMKRRMRIKIFEHEQFGSVRTILIDGQPWFVGKDVADALGYSKSRNAIAQHVDEEDKTPALIKGRSIKKFYRMY